MSWALRDPAGSDRDNRGVGISRVTPTSGLLDDFALRNLDATETNDFYELIVERHRTKATIVTSNRDPSEWLPMMSESHHLGKRQSWRVCRNRG